MTIINKVTKFRPENGASITEELLQAHIDEQNSEGWELIAVDNLVGWYRLFWRKSVE